MNLDFNWDNWAGKAGFDDVWGKTAYLQKVRAIPTCYSPDEKLLYLSSVDYAVDVQNVSQLEQAIDDIVTSYKYKLNQGDFASTKLNLAIRQCDFEAVCILLDDLKNQGISDQSFSNSYNYAFPNELFKELTK